MAKTESSITKELLLENGWVETGDPVFPMKKGLTDKEAEGYDENDGELDMVLHGMQNRWMFAVSIPNGGLLNINPGSMKQLNAFEKMILGFEPNY